MIRVFIGAELAERVRRELGREVAALKVRAPRVRWVRPENLHLTLKFIGELPPADLPALLDAVTDAAAQMPPFVLETAGLGLFPDARRPRVAWAGCEEGADLAGELAGRIDQAAAELGYPLERRRYQPHITLGRIKLPADAGDLPAALAGRSDEYYGSTEVAEVCVFMSELRSEGARYTVMHRAPLGE